jgi:Ca-activated chloride channel family protein
MSIRQACVLSVLGLAASFHAATGFTQSVASFRAGVDIVPLTVSVTNVNSRPVGNLQQSDFTILEDGLPQSIVYFSATRSPIALSLLIDSSASMEGRLGLAQEAAIQFTRQMRPDDLVQVVDFDSRVQITQDFTADHAALEAAVRATQAGGSTSLYNAVYIALKQLERVPAASSDQIRRHAIVLLSDGDDTSSLVGFDEVLEQVKRSNVGMYVIGLRSPSEARFGPNSQGDFVLRQFAQQTGGRAFFPQRAEDLAGVYTQVADEIASQYVLGYVPRDRRSNTPWHSISVRVAKPDCVARTRAGYFASVR